MVVAVVIDVESDGPAPGLYSMVSLGAVVCEPGLARTFRMEVSPLPHASFNPEALSVVGVTREQHLAYENPTTAVLRFRDWLVGLGGHPVMWSDNPAYDWQFVNYYLHRYAGGNPLGFSARRIGDLYCGMVGRLNANREWKSLRQTKHTHDPLDDAKGNAEALLVLLHRLQERPRGAAQRNPGAR